MEIFKNINNFSRYEISNYGRLFSLNYKNSGKRKEIKPALDDGYYKTMIQRDDKKYITVAIHRLVAEKFLNKKNNLEVNHVDGNKTNNHVNNLEYCTHSENIKHAYKIGLEKAKRGELNGMSKLIDEQVIEIRKYANKYGYLKNRKELAKKYNVSEATLKDIVSKRRNNWAHI